MGKHLGLKEEHAVYKAELVGMGLAAELVYAERGITTVMAGVNSQTAHRATQDLEKAVRETPRQLWHRSDSN